MECNAPKVCPSCSRIAEASSLAWFHEMQFVLGIEKRDSKREIVQAPFAYAIDSVGRIDKNKKGLSLSLFLSSSLIFVKVYDVSTEEAGEKTWWTCLVNHFTYKNWRPMRERDNTGGGVVTTGLLVYARTSPPRKWEKGRARRLQHAESRENVTEMQRSGDVRSASHMCSAYIYVSDIGAKRYTYIHTYIYLNTIRRTQTWRTQPTTTALLSNVRVPQVVPAWREGGI